MNTRSVLCRVLGGLVLTALSAGLTAAEPPEVKKKPKPLNVFEGRVLDADGEPVAGATVHVADAEVGFIYYGGPDSIYASGPDERVLWFFKRRNGRRSGQADTDDNGRFVIKGLKKGEYTLLAVHPKKGTAIKERISQPNAGEPIDVTLEAPIRIAGEIKGLPSKGRYLSLTGTASTPHVMLRPSLMLDADGEFDIGPLPAAGSWTLSCQVNVDKQGYSATILTIPIRAEAGKTVRVDIDLTEGTSISGEVRGPKDEPLYGVSVVARTVAEPFHEFGAVTDKKGKYSIRGLSDGEFVLSAMRHVPRTGPG